MLLFTNTIKFKGVNVKWTNERIINEIISKSEEGSCKTASVGQTCATMARRRFGSWENACKEAGVNAYGSKPHPTVCCVDGCVKPVRSKRAQFCEMHYYRMRRTGFITDRNGELNTRVYPHCTHCGGDSGGKKFCSARCSTRHLRGNSFIIECSVCGEYYSPDNKGIDRKVCSDACESIRVRSHNINHGAKNRVAKGSLFQEIDFSNVLVKKSNVCGICGGKIDMELKHPHPRSFTIDHITPLARGGDHTPDNVQCAHLTCNVKKHCNE